MMIEYRYKDAWKRAVRIGDIVRLEVEGTLFVGEVVFRVRTTSFDEAMEAGLHVRVLVEMAGWNDGSCVLQEKSLRVLWHVEPARLTLLSRGRDSVRYLTGEPIRDGDIVAKRHEQGISLCRLRLRDSENTDRRSSVRIELEPLPQGGASLSHTEFAYWTQGGFTAEDIYSITYISRAPVPGAEEEASGGI